jgi:hypothetical protein
MVKKLAVIRMDNFGTYVRTAMRHNAMKVNISLIWWNLKFITSLGPKFCRFFDDINTWDNSIEDEIDIVEAICEAIPFGTFDGLIATISD